MATICSCHRTTVYEWKHSNRLPGHRVAAISEALGIPIHDLLAFVHAPARKLG